MFCHATITTGTFVHKDEWTCVFLLCESLWFMCLKLIDDNTRSTRKEVSENQTVLFTTSVLVMSWLEQEYKSYSLIITPVYLRDRQLNILGKLV